MPPKSASKKSAAKTLSALRADIDAVDDNVMKLLRQRADITAKVGALKSQHHDSVFARPEREADILRRLAPHGGKLAPQSVRAIYRQIISACLACEKVQTICYLGPPHTFTHDAARKHFGDSAVFAPADSIPGIFRRLEKSLCDYAIAPFENSSEGTVGDTFDALLQTSLHINGEIMLRVRHHLWARKPIKLSAVKTVYAHPQALAQCRHFIGKYMPQAKTAAADSNAAAAQWVATQKTAAVTAIASRSAGAHYQLSAVAEDVEDSSSNTTRFFVIGKQPTPPSNNDKTSVIFTVPEKAGALYYALEPLARHKINMTKFESRPSRGDLWQYVFFADLGGHAKTPKMQKALAEMESRAAFLKILGSYPKAAE